MREEEESDSWFVDMDVLEDVKRTSMMGLGDLKGHDEICNVDGREKK